MQETSNMTNREAYEYCGSLSRERIEQLFELEESSYDAEAALIHINEAKSSLPESSFVKDIYDMVKQLYPYVKGENRVRVTKIANELLRLETQLDQECEYASDELNQAIQALK